MVVLFFKNIWGMVEDNAGISWFRAVSNVGDFKRNWVYS